LKHIKIHINFFPYLGYYGNGIPSGAPNACTDIIIYCVTPRIGDPPLPANMRDAGFKTSFSNDFTPLFYLTWRIVKIKKYKIRAATALKWQALSA